MHSHPVHALAQQLVQAGYYDNEPDALRAAIYLTAAGEALRRAECMARHPSALAPLHVA